jgi:hypothetical protein
MHHRENIPGMACGKRIKKEHKARKPARVSLATCSFQFQYYFLDFDPNHSTNDGPGDVLI